MELKWILEALLFSSQQPLTSRELRDLLGAAAEHAPEPGVRAFKKTPLDNIDATLSELEREHAQAGRSYRLTCVAGAWQFVSEPEYGPWIRALLGHKTRAPRLTQPALETLAIVAYRQPLTRAEMEQVRGVSVDGVIQTLLDRGLIEQVGRADAPGRPATYGTTPAFLEYFGLRSLDDLPAAEELRRVPVQKPEALLTVDPGLATAPPEQLTLVDSLPAADPALADKPAAHSPAVASASDPESAPESPAPTVSS
jgi:segregation and condensation protein B